MRRRSRILFLLTCILIVLPTIAQANEGDSRWLYQQRLEVGRALIEVQASNWPTIIPYYTDDVVYRDPVVDINGIDNMTAFLARMFTSSPDLVTTIEDETLSRGIYSASWTMVGAFDGVPYEAKGISIIKFRPWTADVFYQRDYYTEGDIMINIPGLDEAVGGFRTFYRCAVDPTYECPLRDEPGLDDLSTGASLELPAEEAERGRWGWFWLRHRRLEVARALVEINADNYQSLLRFYTRGIEYRDPIVVIDGRDTMAEFLGRLFASSPDLVTTVEDESLAGGVYTATWTMTGMFAGVPIDVPGMSIVKFRGRSARVNYSRDYYSEGDIMEAIPGLDEAIAGFRMYYRCAVDPTYDCPPPPGAPVGDAGKTEAPPAITAFSLAQNAPNPFNPATEISFMVPDGGANVTLRVYDVSGNLVRNLIDGFAPAGAQTVMWQGRNDQGHHVPSGTYFYRLEAPSFSEIKKMTLIK